MRHVMTETWHNYFLDPRQAPDPDRRWLAGCCADAMIGTDRAVSREDPAVLDGLAAYAGPVMVLYGVHDIFGKSTDVVRRRLPQAAQVTVEDSGHPSLAAEPGGLQPGAAPVLLRTPATSVK
jgi:hypothetical protein